MSKEEIIKFIDTIDEQLKKNKEVVNSYAGTESNSDVLTLCTLSQNLVIAKKNWVDMLLYEYGVFYVGRGRSGSY